MKKFGQILTLVLALAFGYGLVLHTQDLFATPYPGGVVSGGDLTLVGSNDSEATTTSTTTVDLITIGSLSIAKTDTFIIVASVRKTTGAANIASVGVKLNGTTIFNTSQFSSSNNATESGLLYVLIPAHDGNYSRGMHVVTSSGLDPVWRGTGTAATPDATITEIIITGDVGDAAITMGVQYVKIYVLAGS